LLLIKNLCAENGTSVLFITHDMGVISKMADDVIVMYCGHVVEQGNVYSLFSNPGHPYTKGLLSSIPSIHGDLNRKLTAIPGNVPSLEALSEGCRFVGRCTYGSMRCRKEVPPLIQNDDKAIRCWRLVEELDRKETKKINDFMVVHA
jgi:oligopeptide/dipeptide ABC transporter ATP-binding protein